MPCPTPPPVTGRLAPTPSGDLHLGNALAFGAAWLSARAQGGRLLLRVEDLDRGRARPEVAARQREDLRWLGVDWDDEVPPQSARRYTTEGLPCFRCACSRAARRGGACACRGAGHPTGAVRFACPAEVVHYDDDFMGPQAWAPEADPVLVRADGEAAYPLAVVVDDHRDGVTEVIRGADLLAATATQAHLSAALGLPRPRTGHVPLLLGPDGRKLSKSHGSMELRALRALGWTPEQVWALLLPLLGLPAGPRPAAPTRPGRLAPGPYVVDIDQSGVLRGIFTASAPID